MSLGLPTCLSGHVSTHLFSEYSHKSTWEETWPSTHTQELQKCPESQRQREVKLTFYSSRETRACQKQGTQDKNM